MTYDKKHLVRKPKGPAPLCHNTPMVWHNLCGEWRCTALAHLAEVILPSHTKEKG